MATTPLRSRTPIPSPRRRHWAVAAAGAVLVVGVAGCSAGSSSAGSAMSASAVPGAPIAADGSTSGGTTTGGSTSSGGAKSSVSLLSGAERSIVVRANTTVRVDDVDAATARLGTIALGHRATIATQATTDGTTPVPADPTPADGTASACGAGGCATGYASSVTTLRLDNSAVDALLHDVAALGTVEATSRTSDDVTADVADVAARVSNANASLARVRALMSRATTVSEVVAIESELSTREGDLEALEARQRTLADQTAQATVTITLLSKQAPAVVADSTGFMAGLRQGWTAFTSALVVAMTVVGALVPFLVLLVPLAVVVWLMRRRRRPTVAPEEHATA